MIGVFLGFLAALTFIPATSVGAAGEPTLVVFDLPGYVHVTSAVDGEINGATLLEANGTDAEAVALDQARSHKGQGRSWRSVDGNFSAVVWVLDYGSEIAAANLAGAMMRTAWQRGTPFDSGLSGTGGASINRNGESTASIFWRQGRHIAVTTVTGVDAARVSTDVTLLARLESDALQHAIGGERSVLDLPEGSDSKSGPARDLTPWVVGGATAMILATVAMVMIFSAVDRRGNQHRSRLPPPPPPRPAPEL